MKRLTIFLLISGAAMCVGAEEFAIKDLSGGMYSYPSANQIPDNAAAYLQNVYTDIEPMFQERNGTAVMSTVTVGGVNAVSGLWRFVDSSRNEWIISFSSRTFWKNLVNNVPVQFGPTMTVAQRPSAAANLGKILFTNGTDAGWWFDGTSTGVSNAPLGKVIFAWRNRFGVTNIASSQSTIRFSADGDGTSWTLAGNPTDPFSLQIGGANDGYQVNCAAVYSDSLVVGRKYDTWDINGFDQADVNVRNFSSEVGCLHQETMRVRENSLLWVSNRGIEERTGSSLRLISDPIRDISDLIVKNTTLSRSNTQTSAADFGAGTRDNTNIDTVTVSGSVRPVFPDLFPTYRNGTGGALSVWTTYYVDSGCAGVGPTADGALSFNCPSCAFANCPGFYVRTFNAINDISAGTTFHFTLNALQGGGGIGDSTFFFILRSTIATGTEQPMKGTFCGKTPGGNWWYYGWKTNGTSVDLNEGANSKGETVFSATTTVLPTTFDFFIKTSSYQFTINSSSVNARGTHTWPTGPVYAYFGVGRQYLGGTVSTATIDNFGISPETGVFTTSAIDMGYDASAWDRLSISSTVSGGTIAYLLNNNTTTTPPSGGWNTVSDNSVPSLTISNRYAFFRSSFTNTLWSDSPQFDEVTLRWFDATPLPFASAIYDRRYWLAVSTNSSNPANDTVLVYQRNNSWTLFKGLGVGSLALWRDKLMFGDSSSTGNIYQFDTGNSDNGSAIASIVRTKSFDLGQFMRQKDLHRLYGGYLGSSAYTGSFSISYDIDRYGTLYSLGSANLSDGTGLVAAKFPFPLSAITLGNEVQYTLTKSGTADRLKLYELRTIYDLKEEQ